MHLFTTSMSYKLYVSFCFAFQLVTARYSFVIATDLRHRYVHSFLQAFKGSSLSGRSLFYASKVKGD